MCGSIVCLAISLIGVDAGWQPRPEGGVEYWIQIEPEMLDTLRSGEPIQSEVPPEVKDVRAWRITVGRAKLPRTARLHETGLRQPVAAAGPAGPTDPFLPPPTTPTIESDPSDTVSPFRARTNQQPTEAALRPQPKPTQQADQGRELMGGPEARTNLVPVRPFREPAATPEKSVMTANSVPTGPNPGVPATSPGLTTANSGLPAANSVLAPTRPGATPTSPPSTATSDDAEPKQAEAGKPWGYLTLVLFGLFASFGGNVYAVWILYGMRSRYQQLLSEIGGAAGDQPE